jgi:hypothetical protein
MGVRVCSLLALSLLLGVPSSAPAQYFGRNKVRYEDLDFRKLRTEHFDIYFSSRESGVAQTAGRLAERWYARISRVLDHNLSDRQAIVLYGSHPDFAQTTVIPGFLGEEIGGVTESLRRRIAMPVSAGLAETDHVLGHEIVHAFQYDIADSAGHNLASVPLWFVEGMAEYLVTGGPDSQTDLIMRDAVAHNRLPSIRALHDYQVSPYRSGQAFWAWLAGQFGDDVVARILKAPQSNVLKRIAAVTGQDINTLTDEWRAALTAPPVDIVPDADGRVDGALLIGRQSGGRINIAPSLSPDGRQIVFLSERDRLSVDVFVADVETGRVSKRLVTTAADPRFDSVQFLSSAPAWSPDSRRVVVAVVRHSRPVLAIYDVDEGSRTEEITLETLDQVFHPNWSPDSRSIVFTGLDRGQSDLYTYDTETRQVAALTDDAYTDLQPVWAPDGKRIAFVSDRFSTDLATLQFGPYRLALMDVSARSTTAIEGLPEGPLLDPQWLPDGNGLYFRASPDGAGEVMCVDLAERRAFRITASEGSVVGVTALSPALSVARTDGRLAFTIYRDGAYEIRTMSHPSWPGAQVLASALDADGAASTEASATAAADARTEVTPERPFSVETYSPKLSLDAVGQPYFLMGSGGPGSFLHGGTSFLFGDLLGRHLIGASFQAGTAVEALAADVQYLNRSSRWNWGLGVGLRPYVYGFERRELTSGETRSLARENERQRQMHLSFSGVVAYPFDKANRIEGRARFYTIWFHRQVRNRVFQLPTGAVLSDEMTEAPASQPLSLVETSVALVRDTAVRGPISPILGQRMRFEIGPIMGEIPFVQLLADYRQYWMPVRPFTLAVRGLHVGRFGSDDGGSRLLPLSLGRAGLVRGYIGQELTYRCDPSAEGPCTATDTLAGSRLLGGQIELRFPLRGLLSRQLDWGPVPLEGVIFSDIGGAWTEADSMSWLGGNRPALYAFGAGVRTGVGGFGFELDVLRKGSQRVSGGWTVAVSMRPGF